MATKIQGGLREDPLTRPTPPQPTNPHASGGAPEVYATRWFWTRRSDRRRSEIRLTGCGATTFSTTTHHHHVFQTLSFSYLLCRISFLSCGPGGRHAGQSLISSGDQYLVNVIAFFRRYGTMRIKIQPKFARSKTGRRSETGELIILNTPC